MDVPEADVVHRFQLLPNAWLILEKVQRILDRELQHVGDTLAAETHLERLTIVPLALAHFTRHVHVRQEMHLDLHQSIALTRFAPSALHVERKATRPVATDFRFW